MPKLPPLQPDSDQMLHLDALRIVGAVMIVVFHFNRFINLDGQWQWADDTIKTFSLIVDLFFLISGYVMAAIYTGRLTSFETYRDFIQKRVARLGPLHWATMLVFIAVAAAGAAGWIQDRDPRRYDVACIVPNIIFVHAWGVCQSQTWNFASWAISAEMGMYLALPLIFLLTARGPWVTLAVALAAIAILLQTPHGDRPFHQWTWDYGVLRAIPGFLIGMAAFQLRDRLAKIPRPNLLMWLLLGGYLIMSWAGVERTILLFVVYAVGLLGVAADAKGAQGGVSQRLAPWAQLSFSLYLLHPIALKMGLAWVGLGMWNLNGDLMRLWVLFWVVALFPIAYLSLVFFERPARDWLAKLGKREKLPFSKRKGS